MDPETNEYFAALSGDLGTLGWGGRDAEVSIRVVRGEPPADRKRAVEPFVDALSGLADDGIPVFLVGDFNTRTERGPSTFDVRHSLSGAFSYDLPGSGRKGAAGAMLRDWSLDAIFRARTALREHELLDPHVTVSVSPSRVVTRCQSSNPASS